MLRKRVPLGIIFNNSEFASENPPEKGEVVNAILVSQSDEVARTHFYNLFDLQLEYPADVETDETELNSTLLFAPSDYFNITQMLADKPKSSEKVMITLLFVVAEREKFQKIFFSQRINDIVIHDHLKNLSLMEIKRGLTSRNSRKLLFSLIIIIIYLNVVWRRVKAGK